MYWLMLLFITVIIGIVSQKLIKSGLGVLVSFLLPFVVSALLMYCRLNIVDYQYAGDGALMRPLTTFFE